MNSNPGPGRGQFPLSNCNEFYRPCMSGSLSPEIVFRRLTRSISHFRLGIAANFSQLEPKDFKARLAALLPPTNDSIQSSVDISGLWAPRRLVFGTAHDPDRETVFAADDKSHVL